MINSLKWPSLQQRRVWADVTLMYKVVNCLIAVPVNYHPITATIRSTRRSHSMKFIPIQTRINAYQNSFFPRTVTTWNFLPESCITSASLDAFIKIINPTRSTCAILCIEGLDFVQCKYMLVVRLFYGVV